MSALRTGRIWRLHRSVIGSPRKATVPACRDSVSCSRRSFADGASRPWRRTKRTSKPHRKPLLRICRKARRISFFRRAFSRPPASSPGRARRRRRPPGVFVFRSAGISRPPSARAFASPPSRAPCAGGFRGSVHHMGLPSLGLRRIGRVGSSGPFRGRIRIGCTRARENLVRTSGIILAPGAIRSCACGVRAHKPAWIPDPCVAWNFPHVLDMPCRRQ